VASQKYTTSNSKSHSICCIVWKIDFVNVLNLSILGWMIILEWPGGFNVIKRTFIREAG
jgi:hypothetical protein